jgi:hypothetical protein
MSTHREAAACYRLYAANCLEIAENIRDRERRIFLLRVAQAWNRLADQVERIHDEPAAGSGGASSNPPGAAPLGPLAKPDSPN